MIIHCRRQSLIFVLILILTTCATDPHINTAVAQSYTKFDLRQSLMKIGKIIFVYGSASEGIPDQYEKLIGQMEGYRRLNFSKEIKVDTNLTEEDFQNNIIFLLGTAKSNSWIKKIQKLLPFEKEETGFGFASRKYNKKEDVLKLSSFPNPFNRQLPLFLMIGNTETAVVQLLEKLVAQEGSRFIFRSWDYEVYRSTEKVVFGNLKEEDWTIDPNTHYDYLEKVDTFSQLDYVKIMAQNNPLEIDLKSKLESRLHKSMYQLIDFVGKIPDEGFTVSYQVYNDLEKKGLKYANNKVGHIDFSQNKVCVLVNDFFDGSQQCLENILLLRHLLGAPKTEALERGLSLYFSQDWRRKGYAYWTNRLYRSGNLPKLEDLLNNKSFRESSDLINEGSSASFVAFLIDYWGKETFLANYLKWPLANESIRNLEEEWHQFLKGQDFQELPFRPLTKEFLKGFNFAHEGYQIYNGYGSNLAKTSIEKLHQIGSNALAMVPYSYMRNPNKATPIPLERNVYSENDESVLFSHFVAKSQGMNTMLKPQIWLGRSWPGDVEMQSDEEWEQFFEYYYQWIIHYAMMAEIYEFDLFCIGVEFAKATIQRPEDWKKLIAKIRGVYGGPLVYAANWGTEFEKLEFWEDLDYIGLDCYYPIGEEKEMQQEELEANFEKVLSKVEALTKKYNKPFIFTEIGFRSVTEPWVNPHAGSNNRKSDEADQNLCYEVVFKCIEKKDWCSGIFWWKWPSYLHFRRSNGGGFTPSNKLAESTVEKWFKKLN